MRKVRLAVVISHPIQHFAPLYASLASEPAITLKVFFLAENGLGTYRDQQFATDVAWDIPLTAGYDHQFVDPGRVIGKFNFFTMDSPNLLSAMHHFDPHVIWLHGYAQLANWRVLFGSLGKRRIIYSSDSNLADSRARWRRLIKKLWVKVFFRRCDKFLSISPTNRRYLQHYGVPEAKIVDSAFPIDMTRWQDDRARLTAGGRKQLAGSLNLPDGATVLLFIGKLIARKRPQDILQALAKLDRPRLVLVVVGSGEMHEELAVLAKKLGIEDCVRFTGFINQKHLAQYFDLADIFVFPSENEPYGATAAESLPFGLPMVVAAGIGAIGASVIEGRNALLYRVGDTDHLTHQLKTLLDDTEMRSAFSSASLKLAQAHDKSLMARDIISICKLYATEST
ncbi:MAG: glycosyltransferase family 4 protein [Gammaproteobacteria bacterium]|nr:glycosyltransferase family 4 protein [Gammaproteobacteria bacterium]